MIRSAALLGLAALVLAGCEKKLEAPTDQGVCWHMAPLPGGKVRFNKVAENVDQIEKCAAALEAMRLRFLNLGGSNQEITGAYQGQYLFLTTNGIFTAGSLDGGRYILLVPTGDGRLARPGAMPVQ